MSSDVQTKFVNYISDIIKLEYDNDKTYDEIGAMLYDLIDKQLKEAKK